MRDWPLALCDLRTVESKDMIPMDEVFVDDVIESYQVHYEEKQRWYYLKDQRVSECLVFKSADSAIHGTGKFQVQPWLNDISSIHSPSLLLFQPGYSSGRAR